MKEQRFILLPAKGLVERQSENKTIDPNVADFLFKLSGHTQSVKPFAMKTSRLAKPLPMHVLDSIHEDGAKLIKIDPEKISDLHLAFPGVRIVPEVFFNKAVAPKKKLAPAVKKLTVGKSVSIKIVDGKGKGISGLDVVAFTDFQTREGADGKSNAQGVVTLKLPAGTKKIERIYVYPPHTYWPLMKRNLTVSAGMEVALSTIKSFKTDSLRHFYGTIADKPIAGTIKVGVIDTGVGTHHAIHVVGGECTVAGEPQGDTTDYDGHGTHVAGIVSSFGKDAAGKPAIEIYAYRVFPKKGGGASNYSIVKAIDRAVSDGCLLINMSLGGGDPDDATKDAITDAHSKGVICFVATGNDDRAAVCFPANFSTSLAVGAMGRKGTFPPNAEANDSIKAPYGKDKKNFVASFSNIGPAVDLIGTGVGIVSCAPNNKYAVMSGTSMACPATTGIAGRLLLDEGQIIKLPADSGRANAMIKFLGTKAKELGFGKIYEGGGMIVP